MGLGPRPDLAPLSFLLRNGWGPQTECPQVLYSRWGRWSPAVALPRPGLCAEWGSGGAAVQTVVVGWLTASRPPPPATPPLAGLLCAGLTPTAPTFVRSPVTLMGTGRHSSSSLSSHASSEAGNAVMLGGSAIGEAPEDLYHHMQVPARARGVSEVSAHCPRRSLQAVLPQREVQQRSRQFLQAPGQ